MKEAKQNILLIRTPSQVFRYSSHPRCFRPPYHLKYLQSLLLERDYGVKLIDGYIDILNERLLVNLLRRETYGFCVFSGTTHTVSRLLNLAKTVKDISSNTFVLAVGQHPTYESQDFIFKNSPIDYILKGEHEVEALNLIEKFSKNASFSLAKYIYDKGKKEDSINLIYNLDRLPFPLFTEKELNKYEFFLPLPIAKKVKWGHLLTSRGCPHECIFCSQMVRETFGKFVRYRSPKNVVDEMQLLKEKGVNVIVINDDSFTISFLHVIAICDEIMRRGLSINWIAHSRVDNVSLELLKRMQRAGCVFLRFGVESGSERIIAVLKKTKHNHKWWNQSIKAFELCKECKISTAAYFIIGNPGETEIDIEKSIDLAKKLKPDVLQLHFFTPYPGSPVFEFYKNKIGSNREVLYHYSGRSFNPSRVPSFKLKKLQSRFYREIFFNLSYIKNHIKKYFIFYLLNYKTVKVYLKFIFKLVKRRLFGSVKN